MTWGVYRHREAPTGFWINGKRTTRARFLGRVLLGREVDARWLAILRWCRALTGGI
jgi:hypothetical protein